MRPTSTIRLFRNLFSNVLDTHMSTLSTGTSAAAINIKTKIMENKNELKHDVSEL